MADTSTYTPDADDQAVSRQSQDDEALLQVARARFERSAEAESELRMEMLKDQQFRAGDQWEAGVSNARQLDQRPCLTINRFPAAIAQVTNEQRQNRPSIRVSPVDSGADVKTAKIFDGLIRHIQVQSRADIAYDTAAEPAAGEGRGWLRVVTTYTNDRSFDLDAQILRIPDPMTVYPQPGCREADYSDMGWCFVISEITHDDFLADYPDCTPDDMAGWTSIGDTGGWVTKDTVRVAEYFYREYEERNLALLRDRRVIELDQPLGRELRQQLGVIDTRTAMVPVIWWCKINGMKVLNRERWPGRWIPVVPVLGREMFVNGKVRLSGLVRDARDSQRMINYWDSAITEAIALAPRAPWVMAAGQDEGFEPEWKQSNIRNLGVLHYNIKDVRGQPVGPPSRNVQEPAILAMSQAAALARDNFKAVTGIYDASLGQRSNEKSGVAIRERDRASNTGNFHFLDNLSRAITHVGRILVDLIPKIYDSARVLRIIGEDGTDTMVTVNAPFTDADTGLEQFYDLTAGTYDVIVQSGPSFATRRQEAVETMVDLTRSIPQIGAVGADILVGNMEFDGAKDLAGRLKKSLPPGVLEDAKGADKDTQLAQATGQLQKVTQEAQALNAHAEQVEQQLAQAQQENAALKQDRQVKGQELTLKRAEAEGKAAIERAKLELEARKLDQEQQKIDLAVQQHLLERARVQMELAASGDERRPWDPS